MSFVLLTNTWYVVVREPCGPGSRCKGRAVGIHKLLSCLDLPTSLRAIQLLPLSSSTRRGVRAASQARFKAQTMVRWPAIVEGRKVNGLRVT